VYQVYQKVDSSSPYNVTFTAARNNV